MKIKELQKTVNIAWSPLPQNPIYLATGSAAQQLDSSAKSTLELYSTNFNDPSYDMGLKSSVPIQYRFQKLIWSPTSFNGTHPNGLLVGGCEGGHIMIYSACKLLSGEECLIARQDKHTGPVTGLDFNPFQTNLLVSSASESEIFIWDLNNTSTHMNPGTKTQPLEDVQNVAWNRQVQHILASVFSSRCVIWDLRKSEQIMKLSDTKSRVRWHAIQWHPEVATQVWLASEDDQEPVVQLWDLRYATSPAKTMQIHQRGMLSMSWCPQDPDIMVSSGKDNRIYCWNPNTTMSEGEILSEVANSSTLFSDVQWCPRNPALIASSSLDGNVSIFSVFGGTQQQVQTSNKIADSFPGIDEFAQAPIPQQSSQIVYHDLKCAPKWMKRQRGVSFGFGGKLVDFNAKSKAVNVSHVITEPELVERANNLQRSLEESNYIEYCRKRADEMPDQNRRFLWYFIKANFELNPKEEMLNLLGYNKEDIDNKFSKYIKHDEVTENDIDNLTNRISTLKDSFEVECDQSTDESTDTSQPVDNPDAFDDIGDKNAVNTEKKLFKIPNGEHSDSLITEALLTGNLEAAVELCMESNRAAEALIIASKAGLEFLINTQNRYLSKQTTELSQIISALVTCDWMDFISRCTVDSWKEALVAILKNSDRKVVDICEKLGDRLMLEENDRVQCTRNAMLCYVCAGSIDKVVSAWYQMKQLEQNDEKYALNTLELQELAEVVMLMSKSLEQQGIALQLDGMLASFISEYGGLLASQGALTAALSYIFALGPGGNSSVDSIRERIYKTVNVNQRDAQQANYNQAQQQIPQKNIYGGQTIKPQQQQQPQHQQQGMYPQQPLGYPAPTPANSLPNQYQTNTWNSPAPPALAQPTVPMYPGMPQPMPSSNKPPKPNDNFMTQPPRPLSASSQSGGLPPRSKYVLDPSVAPSPVDGYGAPYNPAPNVANNNPMMPNSFGNRSFNNSAMAGSSIPQQTMPVPTAFNSSPFSQPPMDGSSAYLPGVPPIETGSQVSPIQNIQRNPTPPPGWNDPPAVKSSKVHKKVEPPSVAAPIMHPLFGVDPNQNQNSYLDPNMQYQNPTASGMPPPPTANASMMNPMTQGYSMPSGGGYLNPAAPNNNPPQYQQQTNFNSTSMPPQLNQQWNTNMSQNVGYTEQPAPIHREPEPPKVKPPLPEEYIYMQTVFEELKNQCLNIASDPRTKRKFVDVAKRLENLYDCLRDGRLTPTTISALNQIVQCIQISDYGNALQIHTSIAFGSDFSQCAGFMPGLKVLIQSAADLQIRLR